jgi:protein involved in polysaccharide export with SLBB domain
MGDLMTRFFRKFIFALAGLSLSLSAQEGPVVTPNTQAPAVPTVAPTSPLPNVPGSKAAALAAAMQAQGQVTPAPPVTPEDSNIPPAKDAIAAALARSSEGDAKANASENEMDLREIRALRQTYKGPFILASDLFSGRAGMRRQPSAASVSDDYRLGSGDEMMLFVFGSATFEVPLVVDRSGRVTVPKVGTVQVAGLRLGDVRTSIQRLVDTILAGSRVDLQFAKLRDVRVFILGEVYLPGSHLVPSLTSLLNALAVSGGPTAFGSYRAIQLIRDAKVIQTLDLYPLRLKGLGMENILLRDGDTIFVPTVGVQVLMDGAFVRVATSPQVKDAPGVLVELASGEGAWEAVQAMGGILPTADHDLLTLQRRDAHGLIRVENLSMTPNLLKATELFPMDILRAMPRADWTDSLVEVAGHVNVPGAFAYKSGLRVADLLLNPMQIQPDTYMGRGQIIRTRDDGSTELHTFDVARALKNDPLQNLILQPRDKVELYRIEDLRLKRTVKVLGPFTKTGTFNWHGQMHAADLIFLAGIPRLNADRYYAELAHMGPDGQPGQVVKLDLQKLLFTEEHTAPGLNDEVANPLLKPFDQITLYELPDFRPHRTVTVSGQVKRPGSYVITDPKVTLSQIIARAGGLTEEAMPRGAIFLRNALEDRDLNAGEIEKAGVNKQDPTAQGLNEILQRLNETKRDKTTSVLLASPIMHGLLTGATNRLVVDVESALKGDAHRDVVLHDGDQIIIPRKAESAYIVGEVASPFASFQVQPGDKVRDVIRMAGGVTRNADTGEVRLLKADGRVLDSWVEGQAVEPGDAILVPQRFRVNTTWQDNLQAIMPLAIIYNAVHR